MRILALCRRVNDLSGCVALVAGATRGAGRGIAVALGEAGATVYVTGRTTRSSLSPMRRPETIEETAEKVTAAGGRGIAAQLDHLDAAQVRALVERIDVEQSGRLDVLVNDIWGGDPLTQWGVPFYAHSLDDGLLLWRLAVETHLTTSWHAVPLMVARGRGLVVEVTDGTSDRYRGSLFYDLAKASVIRLARAQAEELREDGVSAVALTPGFLRSEAMLEHFGVDEAHWRDGVVRDSHFAVSETPAYIGRAVVALAADPDVARWTGRALSTGTLAREYGFTDADGSRPDWERYFDEVVAPGGSASESYR
jgi:NAD(P)-dependent dehydrogenase (short-subunit alcohol dehydrogenase family)